MGWYAIFGREPAAAMQLVASTAKLPALFAVTLVVTLPSLYVFNALVGCRLGFADMVRLLVAAITVNVAVAASLGPILGFFTFSTTSYPFMVLLNVVLLAVAGVVGLAFLLHTLNRLAAYGAAAAAPAPAAPPAGPAPGDAMNPPGPIPGPLEALPEASDPALRQSRFIFRVWVLIYGLVGAQTGWLLRPFIGTPDLPFTWFRARGQGNFFQAVAQQIENLFGG